jgi:GWxTD domain-containing protein
MSNEELDETFAVSRYIANDYEQDQWKKLTTEDAKRKFLFNFWNSRDKNTATPQNEYKSEYFDRVKTANERYTTIQKKGWKTDRGRVLITYGEPSEIERYPNQVDTKPYEIWKYEQLEGGTIFVFADLSGFNDYVLLHSTMRGELRDDLWMRQVRT